MQKILGPMRKAITDFNMIEEGDKIAIGLSGGKDSITLLYAMHRLKQFYPINFEIVAITINPGFDNFNITNLKDICEELNIELIVQNSYIKDIVFDLRNEKSPCSLCANLRRGILNSTAIEHNCNKIALGHHEDDVIETFLLNLFYVGNISTFAPVTYLSRSDIYTIRPMIYVPEKDIKSFAKKSNLPVSKKCCPIDGHTKREYIKNLIYSLSKDIPPLRKSIIGAIRRSNIKGWGK